MLPICKRAKQNKKLSGCTADGSVVSLPVYSEPIVIVSSSAELGLLLGELNEETPPSAPLKPMARSLVPIKKKEILRVRVGIVVGSQGAGPEYLVSGYLSYTGRHVKKDEPLKQNP